MQIHLLILVTIWLMVSGLLILYCWRHKALTVGATLAFAVFLSIIHLLQAIIYLFPWYKPAFDLDLVTQGFAQATLALISFAIGSLIILPALRAVHGKLWVKVPKQETILPKFQYPIAYVYIVIGILGYFVFNRIFSNVPSAEAFSGALIRLWHIGIIIWLWEIFQNAKQTRGLVTVVVMILFWPIVTVVQDGFLGFGLLPTVMVLIFVGLRTRRLWQLVLATVIVSYIILSIVGVYFEYRNTIRNIVWSQEYITSPLEDVYNTITYNFHWLDITDEDQLEWIDGRLGYNRPVGLVVERIDQGLVELGNGRTIEAAMSMLVPRILWPQKPVAVGGAVLFQHYTGIRIASGTSVGLSPVVELYANYRTIGVIAGFLLIGVLVAALDFGAAQALRRFDYLTFAVWYLPIFGLMLLQDDLITIFASTVSGWISAVVVNKLVMIFSTIRVKRS